MTLYNVITSTCWCASLAIHSCGSSLLEQPHQLPHSIGDNHLRIALDQDIQFGILPSLRFLTSCIKAAFGCNRRPSGFQDFGDISPVGNSPSGFLCELSVADSRRNRHQGLTGEIINLQGGMERPSIWTLVVYRDA